MLMIMSMIGSRTVGMICSKWNMSIIWSFWKRICRICCFRSFDLEVRCLS